MGVVRSAVPSGFNPSTVNDVLLRLHGSIPPKELGIPDLTRDEAITRARREGEQVLPGVKVIKTEHWEKGWTVMHLYADLFMAGLRITDCHTEWCGDDASKPVVNVCWRRMKEHQVSREVRLWIPLNELTKGWACGMMHLNPRSDGSNQCSIDLNNASAITSGMWGFPLRQFIITPAAEHCSA